MSMLDLFSQEPLSFTLLLFNMGIGIVFSFILRWHFLRFGSALSNREDFSHVFPFVLLTTLLIITVVKSSLALSLGLVGALSIVRFRTPIKEPEELAYLFIAIATGVGLGANQTVATCSAVLIILVVIAAMKKFRTGRLSKNFYLSVQLPSRPNGDDFVQQLTQAVKQHAEQCDLHRVDLSETASEVTYYVDLDDEDRLARLTADVTRVAPSASLTLIDQRRIPGV